MISSSKTINIHIDPIKKRKTQRILILILFLFSTVLIFFFSLSQGTVKIPPAQIVKSIISRGKAENSQIIWNIRLPRIITACLAAGCLALSGAILQAVMRNPLASPGIIGISSGAGLAATIVLIVIPQYFNLLIPAAFVGALITSFIVCLLSWHGGARPMHLILSGIAVSSIFSALTSALFFIFPDRIHGTVDFMIGSLNSRSWMHVQLALPYAIIASTIALLFSTKINVLTLGDDTAHTLGINVRETRIILISIAALLSATAVSVVGLLGFVGLISPHITRLIIGSDHKFLLPGSIIFSAGLLMLCDTIGRLIVSPIEIPAGIIMSLLGAPFFLYLLWRKLQ